MAGREPLAIRWQQGRAIGLIIVLGASLASCGEKSTQCNRLISVSNQTADQVDTITQAATPQDIEALTRLADTFDRANQQIHSVDLTNAQLQSYRDRFAALYANTAKASRALIAARSRGSGIQQAYDELRSAIQSEDALVTEVNSYCGGK